MPECPSLLEIGQGLTLPPSRELFASLGNFSSECEAGLIPCFVEGLEVVPQDQEDRPKTGLEMWQATSVHPHYPPGGASQAGLRVERNKTKEVTTGIWKVI